MTRSSRLAGFLISAGDRRLEEDEEPDDEGSEIGGGLVVGLVFALMLAG